MQPTQLYVEVFMNLKQEFEIHAASHITGGGVENIPRVLPQELKAQLQSWPLPECFLEVQRRSQMTDKEMLETFNCGVGMVLIFAKELLPKIRERIEFFGFQTIHLGSVEERLPEENQIVWK